jgi:hypothetical protein
LAKAYTSQDFSATWRLNGANDILSIKDDDEIGTLIYSVATVLALLTAGVQLVKKP